ncbi:MAG: hypothetical protein DRP59_02350 [Spirochaetes bacterium]|nr:MAG: hypothetical protein DRP59_02350 [Spirochaetota bacterium]
MYNKTNTHTFQIPVLGTGFSIDTPLKVAKYGIPSVISLVDDTLIEQMRKHHSRKNGIPYEPIKKGSEDWRARRITSYLNLIDSLVKRDFKSLKESPFNGESEICRYFQLLPDNDLKREYLKMIDLPAGPERALLENKLRSMVTAGSIDVNIMTKLDTVPVIKGKSLDLRYSEAVAALRGYAESKLHSAMIFSAGLNPRLFDAVEQYRDFFPDMVGTIKKKIVIKVSDFRSALIQGRVFARKGIWISEFRIESGLNCGGHAFVSKGQLLGPVLEEFQKGKDKLMETIAGAFIKAGGNNNAVSNGFRITVQGGIGTAEEDEFLRNHYGIDRTGWGTPFMLVPDVVNIDNDHLEKLKAAGEEDVYLSQASPLGVLFWNLKNTASELMRKYRISTGIPGAACINKHAAINTEFSEVPLCVASKVYQKMKLSALKLEKLSPEVYEERRKRILAKSCICHDLAGAATKALGINKKAHTALTPGPNIVNFSKTSTLKEMVDHIYGRINIITSGERPHMFIRELELYVEQFKVKLEDVTLGVVVDEGKKQLLEFGNNILEGINYYKGLAENYLEEKNESMVKSLESLKLEVLNITKRINTLQ